MFQHGTLVGTVALALLVMACGTTPAQLNESGHDPYLNGDYPAALDAYENAGELAPDVGEPSYNAGNALYRMEQYDESLIRYDESLRYVRDEARSRGLFNRGNAAYMMESYPEAIRAYVEVLRIDPDDLDAKHNLELALRQIPPDDESPPPEEDESSPPPQSESPPPTTERVAPTAAAGRADDRRAGAAGVGGGRRERTDAAGAKRAVHGLVQPSERVRLVTGQCDSSGQYCTYRPSWRLLRR